MLWTEQRVRGQKGTHKETRLPPKAPQGREVCSLCTYRSIQGSNICQTNVSEKTCKGLIAVSPRYG